NVTLTATYDLGDRRTKLQDNFGGLMTSTYDPLDRLTSRQFTGTGSAQVRIDLTYTAQDYVNTLSRYSDIAGTQLVGTTSYVYDPLGELTNLQHRNSTGSFLANYTYTYDLDSRLLTEVLNGSATSYTYDLASQLTNDSKVTYTYDANGNRTMTGYQTGVENLLLNDGTWTYYYDANGNLIEKTKGATAETWNYTYSVGNQLLGVTQRATDGGTLL